MLTVRKPKASRTLGSRGGFTISANQDEIQHSLVTDDSYAGNPFVIKTPGSDSGSAFEPVSPPRIQRKVRTEDTTKLSSLCNTTPLDKMTFATPQRASATSGKNPFDSSPCDTTEATSLHSPHASPLAEEREIKAGKNGWGKSASFKNQIRQMKKSLPKVLKSARPARKGGSIDLADLAVATIYIAPRHGAGIAVGRMSFERMRTSLMLHMIQGNHNAMWEKKVSDDEMAANAGNGKVQIAKLNVLLRNCIADEDSCFVEKCQETVKLAKDTLEELNANGKSSLEKNELGQRNLICVKFMSGMYREVINEEKQIPAHDGLSLMVLAGAYYALGKFGEALSVYQRAAIELTKKIATSPEYVVHCAKLFNNMACVYFEMRKYEKAMQTYQRALQLFHNENEDNYAAFVSAILDQAAIMNNMAYMLIKHKQYDDASDLVDASFELQQILPDGTDKTLMISTLSTMAYIYYRTRKYKQSLDTYSACVQLQDKNPMYNESDHVEVLKKMAEICRKIKDHEKRIYLLRCVIVYQQCYLLEDDDEIWESHSALAETLQAFADAGGTEI